MNSNEAEEDETVKKNKKVGKLSDVDKLFEANNNASSTDTYVPVIIDKDAFERTMGKFESYKEEEEERQKRLIQEKRRKRLEEKAKLGRYFFLSIIIIPILALGNHSIVIWTALVNSY